MLGVQPEGVSWQALRTRETIGNNMEDISVETERTFFLRDEPRTRQVLNNFWYHHDKFVNSPEVATSLSREVLSKNPR